MSSTTKGAADPLCEEYRQIFQKHGLARIAAVEGILREEMSAHEPEVRKLLESHLSHLRTLRVHVPLIAMEGACFLRKVDDAQYDEALRELDRDLARRERGLSKILIATLIENWRVVRLERAKGRLQDLENALGSDQVSRLTLTVYQISGGKGYLTDLPEVRIREPDWSSRIADALTRQVRRASLVIRRTLLRSLLRSYGRYAIDYIRRNYVRVFVVVGIFGLGIEFFIQAGHFSLWGLGGGLIILGALGTYIFERVFASRWLEIHRRAVRAAAAHVYTSFLNFSVQRALLDSVHDFRSPREGDEQNDGAPA